MPSSGNCRKYPQRIVATLVQDSPLVKGVHNGVGVPYQRFDIKREGMNGFKTPQEEPRELSSRFLVSSPKFLIQTVVLAV